MYKREREREIEEDEAKFWKLLWILAASPLSGQESNNVPELT